MYIIPLIQYIYCIRIISLKTQDSTYSVFPCLFLCSSKKGEADHDTHLHKTLECHEQHLHKLETLI